MKKDGRANAFDSLWQRFMQRALKYTSLKMKFQEKDLRKKTATDMPLESARDLLAHSSPDTTERHYRLGARKVLPHSIGNHLQKMLRESHKTIE